MSIKLRELIRNVRACKTQAEERAVITKECALMRTAFKENNEFRHRNVAKLLFMHMLGYPSHFGQMECLKLIASPNFPEKRIGYLALALLLDESHEVLMLATNSIQSDLEHQNQYIIGLALNVLGNISSADMARDLAPDVDKLLRSGNPFVRKKAALCTIRILKKVPELIEDFVDRAATLLNDRSHSVLLTGVTLVINIIKMEGALVAVFKRLVPALVRILKNLVTNNYAPEHDVAGISDPFLQVYVLQLLALLGKDDAETSDQMSSILAQMVTNTDGTKNAGNAIMYECVNTIMSIEAEGGLRVMAINILGRFLLNRDNNIRFIALTMLQKVVGRDVSSVQRHRNTIVDCLKDPDISIRRRALALTKALVNDGNVRQLVREMLNYLVVAEDEFRADLCSEIAEVVAKYAPDARWHLDTLATMLSIAGKQARESIASAAITLIAQSPDLHLYMTHKLFQHLRDDLDQVALVHVAVWCIGEHGQLLLQEPPSDGTGAIATERDVVLMLERVMKRHSATIYTKSLVLNAMLKLTSRFSGDSELRRLNRLVGRYKTSMHLELQARSCEYTALLEPSLAALRPNMLKPMPVPDPERLARARDRARRRAQAGSDGSGSDGSGSDGSGSDYDSEEEEEKQGSGGSAGGSLSLAGPGGASAAPAAAAPAASGGGDLIDLVDLFGGGSSTPAPAAAAPAPAASGGGDLNLLADIFGAAPSQPPAAPSGGGGGGMLGMMGGMPPAAPAAAQQQPTLDQLLGGGGAPQPQVQQQQAPPQAASSPRGAAFPSIVAYEKNGLRITLDFSKGGADPSVTAMRATFTTTSPAPLTDFLFQAAVPKYLALQLNPASGNTVAMGRPVQQQLRLKNNLHGQKPILMKVKIGYKVNGAPVQEMVNVANFPAGL